MANPKIKQPRAPDPLPEAETPPVPVRHHLRKLQSKWRVTPSPASRPELERFRLALARLLHERGMSASDLAREIWGSTTDSRGYSVARNRDRLTHYLAGTGYPSAPVVQKIASIFNVDPVMLARDENVLRQQQQGNHDGDEEKKVTQIDANISLTTPRDGPPLANITLHRAIPLDYANKILAIYAEAIQMMGHTKDEAPPPAEDDTTTTPAP